MSDIVKRLREQSKFWNDKKVMNLLAEAADYIERIEQQSTLSTGLVLQDKGSRFVSVRYTEWPVEGSGSTETTICNSNENPHALYDDAMKVVK